ncbi:MAG: nucleotidyltransferase family protein [Parachlamydiales bacterium]
MKFGLSEQEYHFIKKEVVLPLEQAGAQVWSYGSRARGDFKKFSDLDLMVESPTDLSKQIGEIQEILSNSNFPFKVDLVQWSEFAEAYKSNYLRERTKF